MRLVLSKRWITSGPNPDAGQSLGARLPLSLTLTLNLTPTPTLLTRVPTLTLIERSGQKYRLGSPKAKLPMRLHREQLVRQP